MMARLAVALLDCLFLAAVLASAAMYALEQAARRVRVWWDTLDDPGVTREDWATVALIALILGLIVVDALLQNQFVVRGKWHP